MIKMKLKCHGNGSAQHPLSKVSVTGNLTQQHADRLRKAHFQQFETRLSQEKKTAMENSNNVSLRLRSF